MASTTSLTIDDFERLPAEAVRNRELVDGALVDVSGNTPIHNKVRDRLIALLLSWLNQNHTGDAIAEQEYFLGNAHGPDVSYYGADKLPLVDNHKRVQRFVPDLAVEIVSATDTYENLMCKKDRYHRAGTGEVWLVSTERTEITIYTAAGVRIVSSGDTLASDLLPGFAIAVDDLFRGL
jgi:Uma2 family endonuclease